MNSLMKSYLSLALQILLVFNKITLKYKWFSLGHTLECSIRSQKINKRYQRFPYRILGTNWSYDIKHKQNQRQATKRKHNIKYSAEQFPSWLQLKNSCCYIVYHFYCRTLSDSSTSLRNILNHNSSKSTKMNYNLIKAAFRDLKLFPYHLSHCHNCNCNCQEPN